MPRSLSWFFSRAKICSTTTMPFSLTASLIANKMQTEQKVLFEGNNFCLGNGMQFTMLCASSPTADIFTILRGWISATFHCLWVMTVMSHELGHCGENKTQIFESHWIAGECILWWKCMPDLFGKVTFSVQFCQQLVYCFHAVDAMQAQNVAKVYIVSRIVFFAARTHTYRLNYISVPWVITDFSTFTLKKCCMQFQHTQCHGPIWYA